MFNLLSLEQCLLFCFLFQECLFEFFNFIPCFPFYFEGKFFHPTLLKNIYTVSNLNSFS